MNYKSDLLYPSYLKLSKTYSVLLNQEEEATNGLSSFVETLMAEITPSLTLDWIRDWELMLDIQNTSKQTLDERRARIVSKLRSSGNITEQRIKEIALSFKNGEVLITEDIPNYKITIRFISEKGIPSNFQDLEETIHKVRPAHIEVAYEFTYNTRTYLKQFTRTKLGDYTRDNLRVVTIQ